MSELEGLSVALALFAASVAQFAFAWALSVIRKRGREILDPAMIWMLSSIIAALVISGCSKIAFFVPSMPPPLMIAVQIMNAAAQWTVALIGLSLVGRYARVLCYRHQVVRKLDELVHLLERQ